MEANQSSGSRRGLGDISKSIGLATVHLEIPNLPSNSLGSSKEYEEATTATSTDQPDRSKHRRIEKFLFADADTADPSSGTVRRRTGEWPAAVKANRFWVPPLRPSVQDYEVGPHRLRRLVDRSGRPHRPWQTAAKRPITGLDKSTKEQLKRHPATGCGADTEASSSDKRRNGTASNPFSLTDERALSPIVSIILSPPICDLPHVDRIAAIREKIETCHLTVKPSTSSTTSTTTADGEKSTASGKLLISQLTKPGAVEQLQWLAEYRISSDYDPTSLLEMAHSGRWTPEVRAAKVKAVAALDPRARATAEAAIAAIDDRAPVTDLQQLAWGHVKALEGYPELQDVYDLGQTKIPDDVLARLCARAFSADGLSVPPALRFARAVKLSSTLKGKSWDTDLDLINDGDACMLSFLEGGTGTETQRIPTAHLYTDISQLLRVRRIGANVLAFFGVRDSSTGSWRQLVSTCEHAFMGVPSSDVTKRNRLGKAMQRFVTRALGDIGKRIDLVRYSAKHDAVGPRSLLPTTRGGPADEFAEAVLRIADDQKRKRSEVADDKDTMTLVCLPSEHKAASSPSSSAAPLAPKKPKTGVGWVDELERKGAAADAGDTDSGGVVYSPLVLQMKHVPHQPVQQVTILVDKKGAGRWLQDHGVQKACLGFQYGHVCKATRRFASCSHHSDAAHTEEASGPHAIVPGWAAAAVTFVKSADRKKMAGQ